MKHPRNKYGFDEFSVGDTWKYLGVNTINLRFAAYAWARARGWRFVTRHEGKNSIIVFRVA